VAGVEHPDRVAPLPQDGGEGLDPERRKGHHADACLGAFFRSRRGEEVEIRLVPNVNEKNSQGCILDPSGPVRQGREGNLPSYLAGYGVMDPSAGRVPAIPAESSSA
jgi:hypothetical protein